VTRYDVTTEMLEDIHQTIVFGKNLFYAFLVLVGLMLTMRWEIPAMWGLGMAIYISEEAIK
jgi:hypothetical protein|tara:strand:+ start:48 stop:230 length:183 start_codon:yes stop_codon:yes gene_type:complete